MLVGSKITSFLLILKEAFILFSLEFFEIFLDFLNAFASFFCFQFFIFLMSIRISFDPIFCRSFLERIWLTCFSYSLMELLLLSFEESSLFLGLLFSKNGFFCSSLLLFLLVASNLFFDSQHLDCLSLNMTLMVINDSGNFPFSLQALKFAFH
jgi:hypothetical protein